jgi:hypothetical protein
MIPWRTALAAALALACSPAAAQHDFTGLLDGGYAYRTRSGGGSGSANEASVHGAGLFTLDNPGFAVQLEGGDDFLELHGRQQQMWSAGGDIFWRDGKGTFGVSGLYSQIGGPAPPWFGQKTSSETGGIFGEYYVFEDLTLQIKGGGSTGSAESSAYFGGGGFTFYDSPDLALHAEGSVSTFTAGRDWTDANASLEYRPFASLPFSVYGGYDWSSFSTMGSVSTVFAGLKIHFGAGRTLLQEQRMGPVEWTGRAAPGAGLRP